MSAIRIVAFSVAALAVTVSARAETVAVLEGLDKTTARTARIEAPVGKQVRFGTLLITARACDKHPPEETPESAAFLEIDELPPDPGPTAKPERIFSGWMFASSPALSALENSVYDISVLDCQDEEKPAGAAPAASASAPNPALRNNSDLTVTPAPRP